MKKYPNFNIVMPNIANYKKIDKSSFAMNFTQGNYENQYKWYDFEVNKKYIDTAKKIFEKFKETPTLYLPSEITMPKPIVLKSKTVDILVCYFSKKLFNHLKAFDLAFFYINYRFI